MRDQTGKWIYQSLLQTSLSVTGSGQDQSGELYLTACSCKYGRTYNPMDNPGGTVWRVVQADKVPQGAVVAPTPTSTPAGTPAATTPEGQATPAASPASGSTQATLEMVDIAFNPKEFTIPANTDVTVTLTNTGVSQHNFSVTDHNNPNVKNLNISVDVQAGQTQTVTINAPAGDYYFYCNVPGHEAAGMSGTMHVQ